eukprot:2566632-Rhodomonas_salina.1
MAREGVHAAVPSSCSSSSSHSFEREKWVRGGGKEVRGGPTSARVNSLDCPRTPFAFLSTEPAHGIRRGQWSAALEVFAAAVGDAIITDFEAGGKAGKGGAGKSLET